jgi:prepilin-type N-terminal cleavage/methylation domain-containing protein/prepilin-type processing-associated H-X9-DG protein
MSGLSRQLAFAQKIFAFVKRAKSITSWRMTNRTSGGFTLIELLVVVTIIAVLASIALPVYSGVQERARVVQDQSNLRQVGLATQMYLNDNDGAFFPPGGATPWMQSLHPKYLAAWKIFQSAFDKRGSTEDNSTAPISYGFNAKAQGTSATDSLLADKITNPSVFVLFAPAQDNSTTVKFTGTPGTAVTVDKNGGSQGTALGGTHSGRKRINACMADLHVENMPWDTFQNNSATTSDPNAAQRWDPLAPNP